MNNDLISRSALKQHKCVTNKFVRIGGRTNGKTLESINKAYQQGWNDAIDSIIDNAPTVEPKKGKWIIDGHHIRCNRCNEYICNTDREGNEIPDKFCPECGADMRKVEEI